MPARWLPCCTRTTSITLKELMWKYRDRPMDLADAALVRVVERDGLDTVFTIDRADFEFYRLPHRKRFRIVP